MLNWRFLIAIVAQTFEVHIWVTSVPKDAKPIDLVPHLFEGRLN